MKDKKLGNRYAVFVGTLAWLGVLQGTAVIRLCSGPLWQAVIIEAVGIVPAFVWYLITVDRSRDGRLE